MGNLPACGCSPPNCCGWGRGTWYAIGREKGPNTCGRDWLCNSSMRRRSALPACGTADLEPAHLRIGQRPPVPCQPIWPSTISSRPDTVRRELNACRWPWASSDAPRAIFRDGFSPSILIAYAASASVTCVAIAQTTENARPRPHKPSSCSTPRPTTNLFHYGHLGTHGLDRSRRITRVSQPTSWIRNPDRHW